MTETYMQILAGVVPILLMLWRINSNISSIIKESIKEQLVENNSLMKDEMHKNKDQLKDQITKFHYDMTRGYDDLKHRISNKDNK